MNIKLDIAAIHLTRAAPIVIHSYDPATKKAKVLMIGLMEQEFQLKEGTDEAIAGAIGQRLLLSTTGDVQLDTGTSNKGKASAATSGCLDRKALLGVCDKACFS